MHLLLLLAAPYFQFEATYLHTSLQLVICYNQHHIVHRGSGTGKKAAANSRIAAAILVSLAQNSTGCLNQNCFTNCFIINDCEDQIAPQFNLRIRISIEKINNIFGLNYIIPNVCILLHPLSSAHNHIHPA